VRRVRWVLLALLATSFGYDPPRGFVPDGADLVGTVIAVLVAAGVPALVLLGGGVLLRRTAPPGRVVDTVRVVVAVVETLWVAWVAWLASILSDLFEGDPTWTARALAIATGAAVLAAAWRAEDALVERAVSRRRTPART
jgi:hypothetical protein